MARTECADWPNTPAENEVDLAQLFTFSCRTLWIHCFRHPASQKNVSWLAVVFCTKLFITKQAYFCAQNGLMFDNGELIFTWCKGRTTHFCRTSTHNGAYFALCQRILASWRTFSLWLSRNAVSECVQQEFHLTFANVWMQVCAFLQTFCGVPWIFTQVCRYNGFSSAPTYILSPIASNVLRKLLLGPKLLFRCHQVTWSFVWASFAVFVL